MSELALTVNSFHKSEMECHGNFGHYLGRTQHVDLMSRIDIYYTTYRLATQTVVPNISGFQGNNLCIKYIDSHLYKPIFSPSYYYEGSNYIRLTCNGNQVEYYTTQNCLVYHQYEDNAIILNKRRSVSGIIHTLLGVAV